MSSLPGIFVTLEGSEGTGKSTLAEGLVNALRSDIFDVVGTSERWGTVLGEHVWEAFLHSPERLHTMSELIAILAAKNELLEKVIRPAISEGRIVICDRFTRSLLAYQGGLRGLGFDKVIRLAAESGTLVMPHLEIFLTASPETQAMRRRKPRDHMEQLALEKAQQLDAYFEEASNYIFPTRRVVIDTDNLSVEDVRSQALDAVLAYRKFHRIAAMPMNAALSLTDWENMRHDRQPAEQIVN